MRPRTGEDEILGWTTGAPGEALPTLLGRTGLSRAPVGV
jgi:hypothetical protein